MTGITMKVKLRHVIEDVDRHGNVRIYVRMPGRQKVRIKELPGTEAFMAAYRSAIEGTGDKPRQSAASKPGSFGHLCKRYFDSHTFKTLDKSTQKWRRRALETICVKDSEKPAALMQARHIRKLRDDPEKPAVGNQRLKALKAMFNWACEEAPEHAPHNPTLGVKKRVYVQQEHATATADEIEQYKGRHPLGTKARLAFDLLRFTTGRREDAPRLGPGHVKNGRIQFRQAKNEDRNPVDVDMPVHPELAKSIAACKSGHMTFLVTEYGKPYTTNGFGNAMRDWFDQANLHHLSAHSLRKATPTMMAEEGATPHELMAITGHQTLEEVERYTRKAQRKKLADSAMAKLKA